MFVCLDVCLCVRYSIGTHAFLYSYRCQSPHAAAGRVLRSRHCFSLPLAGMCYEYACMYTQCTHACMPACRDKRPFFFLMCSPCLPPSSLPPSLSRCRRHISQTSKRRTSHSSTSVSMTLRENVSSRSSLCRRACRCVSCGDWVHVICVDMQIYRYVCVICMYACIYAHTHTHTHAHTQTEDMPYIGTDLSQEVAQAISSGRMHPCTRQYWEDVVDAASTAASSSAPLKLVPQDRSQGGGGGGVGAKVVLSVSLTHCLSVLLSLSLCPSSAYVCMYVCLDVCVCMYLSIYTFIDLCIHLCIYLCTQRTHMHGRANCQLTREDVHMLQM